MTIGKKVAMLRQSKNWTLAYVSELTGISLSHLSAIENGTRKSPSFFMMTRIARAYGVPLAYFDDSSPSSTTSSIDLTTQTFLASEHAARYITFARQLAENTAFFDSSTLLQLIAEFLRDEKAPYEDNH